MSIHIEAPFKRAHVAKGARIVYSLATDILATKFVSGGQFGQTRECHILTMNNYINF